MSSVSIVSADISLKLTGRRRLYWWLKRVVISEKKELGKISIILCSDEYLLDLNRRFLNHDYYTDIITFDYTEERVVSGELYISVDRVKDNAMDYKVGFEEELYRVMVHGVLHLCGYGDKSQKEKKEMRSREANKLRLLEL